MRLPALIFAAALLVAAAPAPKEQFDLICAGPLSKPSSLIEQADVHFRFDLAKNKWCEADCGQVHDILEVQPTVIWLDKSPADTPVEYTHYRQIDRETGDYVFVSKHVFEGASCVKQPFSGFPKFETKF